MSGNEAKWIHIDGLLKLLNFPIAVVDLETTGGHFYQDRITEVAVVRFADGKRSEYQWLVNPEQPISLFISRLTGIDDEMVADAPVFADVVAEILEVLKGCVLVAHNSRFDYTFLQNEFCRCNRFLAMPTLCTVQLSRRLYPQFFKHNLDSIVERLGLPVSGDRHRAMTDVVLLLDFLDQAVVELGEEVVAKEILHLMTPKMLPANTPEVLRSMVESVPDAHGVCVYFDHEGQAFDVVVFERAYRELMQQLQKPMALERLASLEFVPVLGRIHALQTALELRLKYGLLEQRSSAYWTVKFTEGASGALQAAIKPLENGIIDAAPAGVFVHKKRGKKALLEWVQHSRLCPKRLNVLPDGFAHSGECPLMAAGQCQGDCAGFHDVVQHNDRIRHLQHLLPRQDRISGRGGILQESDELSGAVVKIECDGGMIRLTDGRWYFDDRLPKLLKKR